MAGFLDFVKLPLRVLGRLAIDARDWAYSKSRNLQRATRKGDLGGITVDATQIIPRIPDMFNGILQDTDPVLEEAGGAGYDLIYGDHGIVQPMDDLCLTVAASEFSLQSDDPDSRKLIAPLSRLALNKPTWSALVSDLPHALIQGVRIFGMVFDVKWCASKDRYEVTLQRAVVKNKTRFAPLRPDWSRMALVDDGSLLDTVNVASRTGFAREVERSHFIVGVWRDREDRLGWGAGLGPILYKLAYIRDRLLHILCRAIEMHGGGIRYATLSTDDNAYKGQTGTTATSMRNTILDSLRYMNSFDAAIFPPGVDVHVVFPTPGSIEAVQNAITGYFEHAVAKLITGTTMVSGAAGSSASGGSGKARILSETERIRKQYVTNWVCEILQRDYIQRVAEYNPWIYTEAGVSIDTPLPRLVGTVPGGHDRLEEAQILAQLKMPVLLSEAYRKIGYSQPTQDQIDLGEVFDPGATGLSVPMEGTEDNLNDPAKPPTEDRADRNAKGNEQKSKKTALAKPPVTP